MQHHSNTIYHLQLYEYEITFTLPDVKKIIFDAYVIFRDDKSDIYTPIYMIYPNETNPLWVNYELIKNTPHEITELGNITDFPEYFV